MPKGNIPDRWLPYTACGKIIEGTRIICFKVPLRKEVQQHIPGLKTIWDVPTVIEEIPDLAGVIDLTNTNRYYNPNEFTQANVMYKKILMPGREIPPEQKVIAFMDAVDEFLGKDGDKVVGVHCTHGLNRTGYMVCRYMIDRLNVPGEDAINRFQEARGFKIERDVYISALLKKNILSNIGKRTAIRPINNKERHIYKDLSSGYGCNNMQSQKRQNEYKVDGSPREMNDMNGDDGYLSWRKRGKDSTYNDQHPQGGNCDGQNSRGRYNNARTSNDNNYSQMFSHGNPNAQHFQVSNRNYNTQEYGSNSFGHSYGRFNNNARRSDNGNRSANRNDQYGPANYNVQSFEGANYNAPSCERSDYNAQSSGNNSNYGGNRTFRNDDRWKSDKSRYNSNRY